MNAKTPSLLLYLIACCFTVLFVILGQWELYLYAKSLVVPTVFVYYFITNNYKIDILKGGIFLLAFIGDVFILMNFGNSETVTILSFILVYILLITYISKSFKKFKPKIEPVTLLTVVTVMMVLAVTILSLRFEKMKTDFSIIIIYSIVLSTLIIMSVVKYIAKGTVTFLNLLIMSVCFLLSDVFYVINSFYLSLSVFNIIENIAQVFSYYFMVNYFIGNEKKLRKLDYN